MLLILCFDDLILQLFVWNVYFCVLKYIKFKFYEKPVLTNYIFYYVIRAANLKSRLGIFETTKKRIFSFFGILPDLNFLTISWISVMPATMQFFVSFSILLIHDNIFMLWFCRSLARACQGDSTSFSVWGWQRAFPNIHKENVLQN